MRAPKQYYLCQFRFHKRFISGLLVYFLSAWNFQRQPNGCFAIASTPAPMDSEVLIAWQRYFGLQSRVGGYFEVV
jgi:hypothetical protein